MPRKAQTNPAVMTGAVVADVAWGLTQLSPQDRALAILLAQRFTRGGGTPPMVSAGVPVVNGGKAPSAAQLAWWNRKKNGGETVEKSPQAKYGEKLSKNGKPLGRPPYKTQPERQLADPEASQIRHPPPEEVPQVEAPCTHSQIQEKLLTLPAGRSITCPECTHDILGIRVESPKVAPHPQPKGKKGAKAVTA